MEFETELIYLMGNKLPVFYYFIIYECDVGKEIF